MINALLGVKKTMTSTYDSRGRRVGATILEVTPNIITQVKTLDSKDGYDAVQLGFGHKKSVRRPQLGVTKKLGLEEKVRWFKEIRVAQAQVNPGQKITVSDIFLPGDTVKITGKSKGKGFQGGVRRHGFAGGPKTHGQSDRHRAPGSIGQTTTPGRVYKGKKMAGHMGFDKSSVRNLEVISVNGSNNLMVVKGAVPGVTGSLVLITKLGKVRGYTPPPEEKVEEEDLSATQAEDNKEEKKLEASGKSEEKKE